MSATTSNNADPAGDLVLLVGSEQVSMRVSSTVLSLASPVLAAILSPKFAEGHALGMKKGLITINLPEDDPEAMAWIFNTLHFRQQMTSEVSFPLLEKLAVVCDKYDMSVALGSWSEVWLSRFTGSKDGEDCFAKMLWISHAPGNHHAFWRISRDMIRAFSTDELREQVNMIKDSSLPEAVIGEYRFY